MARNKNIEVYLYAEYKPLLSILNVVLAFPSADKNSQESEAAVPFFIDVEANSITYRIGKSKLNFILKQIEMYPASCRGMRWDPSSELHFTLQAKSEFHAENDMSGIFSHLMELEKSSEGDIITVIEQCPSSCCCSGCGQPVFSQNSVFKRVLPLPSENWSDFADNWFCHKHPHNTSSAQTECLDKQLNHLPKMLVPRPGDCLVGNLYLLVDGSQLCQDTVSCSPAHRLLCRGCGNFLGFVLSKEHKVDGTDDSSSHDHHIIIDNNFMEGSVHKIYLHAVTFSRKINGGFDVKKQSKNVAVKESLSGCHRKVEDFLCKFLRHQSHQFTSFRFLIQSSHEEQRDQLPILLMVWLLDQNLEVFSCSRVAGLKTSSAEVHPLKVMKILYKGCFLKITDPKLAWVRDNSVHGLDLPHPLCEELLSTLINSTKSLPLSQRSLNGFHVGYLQFE
ncbi:hypothetical protein C0Q70_10167 [Pomacea canaliculata]|uniref:E3 ubiquitin-protein ligase E3D n=1 Tax=Pomacea canaliculata TaxID=400727 RepID=A0A2T7PBV7_POMCA|nr:hypothetical protein C0Q70_10167 [Pomacea canaliculata]